MNQSEFDSAGVPVQQTNGLAIAGFICSLAGLVSGGHLLSPIGVILSLVALGRPYGRGWAIAGLVIGLLGTCGWLIAFLVGGAAILAALGLAIGAAAFVALAEPERAQITADMAIIAAAVVTERAQAGTLPASLSDLDLDDPILTDPWGNPYRYILQPDPDTDFELVSNGPDGQTGTHDDIQLSKLGEYWEAAQNLDIKVTGSDEGGRVVFQLGDRTIEIIGDEDSGHIKVDLGDRIIEIRGDEEGGVVTVTPKAEDDAPSQPDEGGGDD